MNVLFLVLNKTEDLEEVLSALKAAGIRGATIIDSQGMGSAIVSNDDSMLPLFGSLKTHFDREHPYNKTIFTVIEGEERLNNAIEAIRSVVGDLDKPNEGLLFTVPVGQVMGLGKE